MSVIIIDDSPVNVMLMQGLARQVHGGDIHAFTNPLEAMTCMPGEDPDLILVDYMMPEIDGLEVIARLRADPRLVDTPIVMVTTADQRAVRIKALEEGATDFITKPIDATEFKARMRNLLRLKDAARLLRGRADELAREVAKATKELADREEEIILRLSRAAEYRDSETGMHILRMAHYSRIIAEGLGCDPDYVNDLWRAAPMHDVGKIAVPDAILLKPGRFTPEERVEMERHTRFGQEILGGSQAPLIKLASEIAGSHHERWDGKGYPLGLSGTDIPLSGRIAAVADVFDALTSERPYKKPWSLEQARAYLVTERGQHFDPACVDAFFAGWARVLEIHATNQDIPQAA
ncbi:MAG: response regulator [Hyphomicrobiaceae bacterium]|nr:response regulator [Hyphomicrobiaceae bacterium]